MAKLLETANRYIWGLPTLLLILGAGIFICVCTRCVQLRWLPKALRLFVSKLRFRKRSPQGTSAYRALCTALAATVGTGNIAGVAGAIALGGPGAIFWMWVCAFLGMGIKYAEAALAVRFRTRNSSGDVVGGPMYMIRNGLHSRFRPLAYIYCFFAVVAAFGVGNATQINTVIAGINSTVSFFGGTATFRSDLILGGGLTILTAIMFSGGAKRIGSIAERLVPFASVCYLLFGFGVLIACADRIFPAFAMILKGAFTPAAVTGGAVGSMLSAIRVGSARGIFTNEAGMGTASIAHACADVSHPAEQGLMGIMEVFIDTILICTMTALVILCSGVPIAYGQDLSANLTTDAFSAVYGPWICIPIALSLCCFAIATILGWGLYGIRSAQFLFGDKVWKPFVLLQLATVMLGAILKTETVWLLAEIVNGLMSIPNLIALVLLSPELVRLTKEYQFGTYCADGGSNENFNQCQPVRAVSYAEIPPACGKGRKAG